jgi:hypothetical protein
MRATIALTILILLCAILVYGAYSAMDALTYPWGQPPITWPDDPIIETPEPTPTIVEPGTPIQPPIILPPTQPDAQAPEPKAVSGCPGGVCPTSQPDANVGQGSYRRGLFNRRFR